MTSCTLPKRNYMTLCTFPSSVLYNSALSALKLLWSSRYVNILSLNSYFGWGSYEFPLKVHTLAVVVRKALTTFISRRLRSNLSSQWGLQLCIAFACHFIIVIILIRRTCRRDADLEQNSRLCSKQGGMFGASHCREAVLSPEVVFYYISCPGQEKYVGGRSLNHLAPLLE